MVSFHFPLGPWLGPLFLVDSGSTNSSVSSELSCTHFLASPPSLILNAIVWIIFHTNILEAVTIPILVNAWIWTSMLLCKLTLPFGLGYLVHPIWNPFDLLGFRPNIFPSIFVGVFCSILAPQPIHHWSLSQMLTFSLLHHLLGFPYPSHFWTFKSRNLQVVKSLFSTLSMCCICQANNTSILLCSTFCKNTKLQKNSRIFAISLLLSTRNSLLLE